MLRPEHKMKVLHSLIAKLHSMPNHEAEEEAEGEEPSMAGHGGVQDELSAYNPGMKPAMDEKESDPGKSDEQVAHAKKVSGGSEHVMSEMHGQSKMAMEKGHGKGNPDVHSKYPGPKGGKSSLPDGLSQKHHESDPSVGKHDVDKEFHPGPLHSRKEEMGHHEGDELGSDAKRYDKKKFVLRRG